MKTIFLATLSHAILAAEYLVRHHAPFSYELVRSKPDTPHRFSVPGWLALDLENWIRTR